MHTSTPGEKGYLETLQKTKDHERCFDLCQGLVSPQLSWTFCHRLQMLELQPLPLHLPGTTEVYAWCETLKACPKEIPEWQVFHQNCGGQKEVALHFASVLFIFFLKTSTRILFIQGKSLYFRQRKSKRICHWKSVLKGWPIQGTMWKKKSWNNRKKKYESKILC